MRWGPCGGDSPAISAPRAALLKCLKELTTPEWLGVLREGMESPALTYCQRPAFGLSCLPGHNIQRFYFRRVFRDNVSLSVRSCCDA